MRLGISVTNTQKGLVVFTEDLRSRIDLTMTCILTDLDHKFIPTKPTWDLLRVLMENGAISISILVIRLVRTPCSSICSTPLMQAYNQLPLRKWILESMFFTKTRRILICRNFMMTFFQA